MEQSVEPWLRGTLVEFDPLRRAVLHALLLAGEDAERWVMLLSDVETFARPAGLPSVAFHLNHIVRSLDRLLTYADGQQLSTAQWNALRMEMNASSQEDVLAEFRLGLSKAFERVTRISPATFAEQRGVGRKMLPTTVGGLLVHCADHTQRHAGQMVTTAKLLLAERST